MTKIKRIMVVMLLLILSISLTACPSEEQNVDEEIESTTEADEEIESTTEIEATTENIGKYLTWSCTITSAGATISEGSRSYAGYNLKIIVKSKSSKTSYRYLSVKFSYSYSGNFYVGDSTFTIGLDENGNGTYEGTVWIIQGYERIALNALKTIKAVSGYIIVPAED